ncbi:MAG TPA: glycosyltransferase [Thermoanaerobaculia bacterium]|nr:glycosyltransferase [Thermoanaerobaculia bacterium]
MRLAIVIVHYHTPELAAAAIAALRTDLEGAGLDAEWLLVDNGSDERERALLAALPVQRIDPRANVGYAGGVNLGVASSRAETILLMNPDVFVEPGCVAALLDALAQGAAAAGPRFFWDRGKRLVLPPAEVRSRRGELLALLSRRGGAWAARARARWRRPARRHWEARGPLLSHALSGSLLAIRRAAWDRVGAFDPGFQLYFEETDWLLRARRAGLEGCYVPAATAIHLYGQSAAREPRSQAWFEESARRFRRLHYGAWFESLLSGLDRRFPPPTEGWNGLPPSPAGIDLGSLAPGSEVWVEVSPNPAGFPAAAERLPRAGRWTLPAEIRARFGGDLHVCLTDDRGRELGRYRLPGEGGLAAPEEAT